MGDGTGLAGNPSDGATVHKTVGVFGTGGAPRVRGADVGHIRVEVGVGCIPARAGSSAPPRTSPTRRRVHPRACGEQRWAPSRASPTLGASPRVRGAVLVTCGFIAGGASAVQALNLRTIRAYLAFLAAWCCTRELSHRRKGPLQMAVGFRRTLLPDSGGVGSRLRQVTSSPPRPRPPPPRVSCRLFPTHAAPNSHRTRFPTASSRGSAPHGHAHPCLRPGNSPTRSGNRAPTSLP